MRKLFIAVPSYSGSPCKDMRRSLRFALPQLGVERGDWQFNMLTGNAYICQARNILAHRFLNSDCTDMLFLDDDLSFPADALRRIRDISAPMVAAIYRKKCDDMQWPVEMVDPLRIDSDGLAEAKMVPTGFLKISRAALEFMAPHVPLYRTDQHGDMRAFFMTGIRDGVFWGEDTAFCHAFRAQGGKIQVLLDMDLGHTDKAGRTFRGNFGRYLAEQNKRAA